MAGRQSRTKKMLTGAGLGAVALAFVLANEGGGNTVAAGGQGYSDAAVMANAGDAPPPLAGGEMQEGGTRDYGAQVDLPTLRTGGGGGDALEALAALAQIRQQQCQMGNQPACQALPQIPGYREQLVRFDQACRAGDRKGCGSYQSLAQRIITAYSQSAAVMQSGAAAMARMDAWRAGMNANAAASMAALQARGAAGQAAHAARQEGYAAHNRAWAAGQASSDRSHGRFVDGIYNGTTMQGGGVQARIDYGNQGYTDGHGNVVAIPNGADGPDGWQAMDPAYAAPR